MASPINVVAKYVNNMIDNLMAAAYSVVSFVAVPELS